MSTYIFGEGPGGDASGNHKDTYIISAALGASGAAEVDIWVSSFVGGFVGLMRFDLSAIPAGETVTAATLRIYLSENNLIANSNIVATNIITNWGVTNTDEGVSANPAAAGQATWRRSFDFNGTGGDVTWAAGNLSAADVGVVSDTVFIGVADPAGTPYDLDMTALVAEWCAGTTANYGFGISNTALQTTKFHSQSAVDAAVRPALLVTTIGGELAPSTQLYGQLHGQCYGLER